MSDQLFLKLGVSPSLLYSEKGTYSFEFETIVAVAHPHPHENREKCWVVAPCGMCRELISDYGKNTDVIISYQHELVKCNVLELLPEKYAK